MFSSNSRISNLPLTPVKLNYYLSQCKKKTKRHIFQQTQSPILRNPSSHHYNGRAESGNLPPGLRNNNNICLRQINESLPRLQKTNLANNQSTISLNGYDYAQNLNDSLDGLMTDRMSYKERTTPSSPVASSAKTKPHPANSLSKYNSNGYEGSLGYDRSFQDIETSHEFMNNDSSLSNLSPRHVLNPRNNVQYYRQRKSSKQERPRRVNWNLHHENTERKGIYLPSMDKSFKQISHQLSKITYELNRNSTKLEQISKLYRPIKKVNAQESLKRANLKYAEHSKENNNQSGFRCRPIVEYQDKDYNDPRFLIWQPQHKQNTSFE